AFAALRSAIGVPLAVASEVRGLTVRAVRAGEGLLAAAEQAPGLVVRLEAVIADAQEALAAARAAIDRVSRSVDGAEAVRSHVQDLVDRARDLESTVEGSLTPALPILAPLIREARAVLPELRGVLPILQRLEPVFVDMETRMAGVPGASRMLKRGEKELDESGPSAESDDAS
ncbi:MAG: hypothetical protein JWN20_1498, partial [Jatrophihabitantaceae bacterium]|nr:hypothetical protein [Jatrophihabitantaceae bacterium]